MKEKILIVDDEEHVIQGYKRNLRKRFELDLASSGKEALEILERNGPHAIIVADMQMPGMNGLELLQTVKDKHLDTVRIMLTGNADQKTAVDAVNKGEVFKFLTKPCSPDTMIAALESGLEQHRKNLDFQKTKQAEKQMTHLAHHDQLTGLPNRLLFGANLDQALEHAKRHKKKVALLFLDLDRFKEVNDTLGHDSGDQLLQTVAQRLQQCVRSVDTVARLGGDEFTIILDDISQAEDALIVTRKIIETLNQPIILNDQQVNTGASIGVSIYPDNCDNKDELIKTADVAMYRAKQGGRGCYQLYLADHPQ